MHTGWLHEKKKMEKNTLAGTKLVAIKLNRVNNSDIIVHLDLWTM